MKIIRKDAPVTATGDDMPGTFEAILSAPTLDRDGETLLTDEWKMPLPDRITVDVDHGMTVASTIGSAKPWIDEKGNLCISGTFASTPKAQEVRTLMKEGHINTTSVAFMSEKTQKGGKSVVQRELLNAAVVAIPSNREALVLSSKAAEVKIGARNAAADMEHIQGIHDHTVALGASCAAPAKSAARIETKAVVGSLEATQERVRDALSDAYPDKYVWLRATLPTEAVFDLSEIDGPDSETLRQPYTDDGTVVTLTGTATPADVAEIVTPDPDEAAEPAADVTAAAAEKSAAAAATKAAEDADSDEMQIRAARLRLSETLAN